MKASELRIGNWVNLKDIITTYQKVIMIDSEVNVIQCQNDIHSPLEDYEPIPLTEEILSGWGFEYDDINGDSGYWQKRPTDSGLFRILLGEDGFVYDYQVDIKYVHQLQNLYFALTNEELKIEL